MKRIIFAFIFVLLVSCGVEELYESNQVEHITYKEISDMELLSRWGYDTTDVKTFDEYYLLYDEIVFYKADLKPHKTVPVTKLYTYQQRLPLEGQHLRLGFYSPIEASNKQYLNDAIYQWNGLEDCNILFATSDDSGQSSLWPEVPIEISDNPWLETSGMLTISPLVGNSGDFPRVLVNTSHSLWKKLPDNQKTYAIMHALGHLVGLLDSDDDNRYGYVPYSNNGEDMFSIMKPVYRITNEWVNNYWSGFSAYDKDDIPLLFPLKPESVDFSVTPAVPNNSLFEDTDYTISVNTVSLKEMTNISYQLRVDYIDSNTYDFTMSSEEPKFNINLKHPGECKMTVTLLGNRDWRNDKTRAIAEKEFHVAENTLSFPENITLGEDCLFEWQYNNPNYPNARIRFSASESYFDNGSGKNVTIDYISNHSANIRFNDYGNYTITAEILNGPANAPVKYVHFRKLYRPEITIPSLYFEIIPQSIEAGSDVFGGPYIPIPEDFSGEYNLQDLNYSLILGDEPTLQERVYVDYALKYYQNTNCNPAPTLHYLFIDHLDKIIAPKGRNNVFALPKTSIMEHPDSARVGVYDRTVIAPFYIAEYPEDVLYIYEQ